MAKKQKEYWYVIVMTMYGAVFVTDINISTRDAEFDKNKKPKEFDRENAQQLAIGLIWNGNVAYPVCTNYKMEYQPYRYELGEFEWRDKNDNE